MRYLIRCDTITDIPAPLTQLLHNLCRARAKSLLKLVVQSVGGIKGVLQHASTGLLQLAERPRSVSSRRSLSSSTWEALGAELQSLCSPEWMEQQAAGSSVGAAGVSSMTAAPAAGAAAPDGAVAGSSSAGSGAAGGLAQEVQQLAASFQDVADKAVEAVAKRLKGPGGGQQGLQVKG
jgi:hypothetical protein